MAARYHLAENLVRWQLSETGIVGFPPERYASFVNEAARRMAARDPDDVPLLALALALEVPVWSNDNDFEEGGVTWFTTAELLRLLNI